VSNFDKNSPKIGAFLSSEYSFSEPEIEYRRKMTGIPIPGFSEFMHFLLFGNQHNNKQHHLLRGMNNNKSLDAQENQRNIREFKNLDSLQ
jgi:hypothetical protein